MDRWNIFDGGVFVPAAIPVSLAAGAVTGPWMPMRDLSRLYFVLVAGAGTATEDPVLTFEQAQDDSGTGVKALKIGRVITRIGADIESYDPTEFVRNQDGVDRKNKVSTFDTADTVTSAGVADAAGDLEKVIVVEVLDQDMDGDNDFTHVRCKIAATDNAQLATLLYIADNRQYISG
ncbi:hypothetical protein [Rosistilla oblonga]|uniref:hypothetical protein n=1 Tax=Rosistilla oblonga TaxID=2527990 RepID=UPI003A96E583